MTRPTRRLWPLLLAAFLLLVGIVPLGGAAGCRSANPVATALTADPEYRAETVAFALYATYAVVDRQALLIAKEPQTPVGVKRALLSAHKRSAPVAEELQTAAAYYNRVRQAGDSAGAVAALNELNRVLTEAAPRIDSLAKAVTSAGGGS